MDKLSARNMFSPLATGLILFGSLSLNTVQAQEQHTYLVSVQDANQEHLCNGSYIGNNQILFSPDCRQDVIISPIPTTNSDSNIRDSFVINEQDMTNPEQAINSTPFPLPSYPIYASFTLPDGTQSSARRILSTQTHPYTGHQLIATVFNVPDGIEALTLANDDLINKLEAQGNIKVEVVGRYYSNNSNDITVKPFTLNSAETCTDLNDAPLSRRLCLTPVPVDPFPSCTIDVSNKSTGAPIVYSSENGKVLLGYKKKSLDFRVSCNHWASTSQYTNWLALSNAKQQGLSIATAYDLGERPLTEPHKLTVTIENQSNNQKFDINNAQFQVGEHFSVKYNSCETLEPGESCNIFVYGRPDKPVTYEDMLTMNINGEIAGTYVVAKSIGKARIRDDHTSPWNMKGWTQATNSLFGSVVFTGTLLDQPSLERSKYLVNPKNVTITYRASGDNQWLMFLQISRQGLFGDGPSLLPVNTLKGTNDQWVTQTFEITEPGTYKASITRGFSFFPEGDVPVDIEISSICFNDCAN